MSRFVDRTATKAVDLGPCECPGAPHPKDEATVRSDLAYPEVVALGVASTALEVAETWLSKDEPFDGYPVLAGWNLLGNDGTIMPLSVDTFRLLKPATLHPLVAAVNESIEASEAVPNRSGAHSRNGSRVSASPSRR